MRGAATGDETGEGAGAGWDGRAEEFGAVAPLVDP